MQHVSGVTVSARLAGVDADLDLEFTTSPARSPIHFDERQCSL
jgi:hypothetical protein